MHALGLSILFGLTAAAPPPAPFCVPAGYDDVDVERASVVGGNVRFCLANTAHTHVACGLMSRATGLGQALASTAVPPPPAPAFTVRAASAREFEVCKTSPNPQVPALCTKLSAETRPGERVFVHEGSVSLDGTKVAVHVGAEDNIGRVDVWDVRLKRRIGAIDYAVLPRNCGKAWMLGTTVAVAISACAEPADKAPQVKLYKATGQLIGRIGDEFIDLTGAAPIQTTSARAVFVERTAKSVLLVELATAKVLQRTPLPLAADFGAFVMIRGATTNELVVITGSPPGQMTSITVGATAATTRVSPKLSLPGCK